MTAGFVRYLTTILGFLFLVAGLGKVFLFIPFAEMIADVLHVQGIVPGALAGFIVLTQLSAGAAFLGRFKTVIAGSLLFLMMCVFIWILSVAIMQGREIQCHCFGILNLRLSNRWEMILDLSLLNLLAVVVIFSARRKPDQPKGNPVLSAASIVLFLFVEYAVLGAFLADNKNGRAVHTSAAVLNAETLSPGFANFRNGNRLLFLLEFSDFNCPPCFDDFMTLCEEVKERFPSADSSRYFLMFRRGVVADPGDPGRLNQWLRGNGLNFPARVGPDSLFERPKFEKSCVMVISPSGRSLFSEILPIGRENHELVIRLLADSYAPSP